MASGDFRKHVKTCRMNFGLFIYEVQHLSVMQLQMLHLTIRWVHARVSDPHGSIGFSSQPISDVPPYGQVTLFQWLSFLALAGHVT